MNADTIKQQLSRARGAYSMGTVDRETLDDALAIIEREATSTSVSKPLEAPKAHPDLAGARIGNPANAVPEQVGRPFQPGGTVVPPEPNQTVRNRP